MTDNPYEPQQQPGYPQTSGYQPYAPQSANDQWGNSQQSGYEEQQGYGQQGQQGYGQQGQQGYGQPYPPVQANPYQSYRAGLEHPQAVLVLVLGICGFVTWGITGLIAWIIGRKVLREIDSSGQPYINRGNVQIGYVLGIVTTLLYGIGTLAYIGFFVVYLIFIVGMLGATS